MANERYMIMTEQCPRCKTKQRIHVGTNTGAAHEIHETILCVNCNRPFKVSLPYSGFMEKLTEHQLKLLCIRAQYERDPQKLLELMREIHAFMNALCEQRSKSEKARSTNPPHHAEVQSKIDSTRGDRFHEDS